MSLAGSVTMAGKPKARQKSSGQIAMKASGDLVQWVDNLVTHSRQGTRSLLLRNALYEFARAHGYKPPMPER